MFEIGSDQGEAVTAMMRRAGYNPGGSDPGSGGTGSGCDRTKELKRSTMQGCCRKERQEE